MRIPGLGGRVLHKMSHSEGFCVYGDGDGCDTAENIPVHGSDIADLINKGKIHAFEFTGPYDDNQILEKILDKDLREKFIYHYPGWWEPSTTFELQINRQSWDKLPESFQSILRAACAQIYKETLAEYNDKNSSQLNEMSNCRNKDIKIERFSDSFLENAERATKSLLDNYAEETENFKFAYDEWIKFKDRIRPWSDLNLQSNSFKGKTEKSKENCE